MKAHRGSVREAKDYLPGPIVFAAEREGLPLPEDAVLFWAKN